jgi:hypothetical protein
LAERLSSIGEIFGAALKLREDSNYESLILAHQYRHRSPSPGVISVEAQFSRATNGMLTANRLVLQFLSAVLLAAFKDELEWFCPKTAFSASEILKLMFAHVNAKIVSYSRGWTQPTDATPNWTEDFAILEGRLKDTSFEDTGEAKKPAQYAQFSDFEMKRGIMREFRDKVRDLDEAIHLG